ncbi:MAG: class I SAM-dependent methyltransferase [Verrucomicrobia bacterium]|nr:class I SAM-dependent methyltransferase [Cytophagales bacterium]
MLKNFIKKLIPKQLYEWRINQSLKRYNDMTPEQVFTSIYEENVWGGKAGEFCSGSGTTNPNVGLYVEKLVKFIQQQQIKSVLDIGCGDFRVMKQVTQQTNVQYTGGDLVKSLINFNQKQFANEKTNFQVLNAITDELPKADMLTIRQVFQHLSNEQIISVLQKTKDFKYILVTEHIYSGNDAVANLDKKAGPDIRLYKKSGVFLETTPFDKKASVFLEYAEDMIVFGKQYPALMRTYLIEN